VLQQGSVRASSVLREGSVRASIVLREGSVRAGSVVWEGSVQEGSLEGGSVRVELRGGLGERELAPGVERAWQISALLADPYR
jgi:hypothetical protein